MRVKTSTQASTPRGARLSPRWILDASTARIMLREDTWINHSSRIKFQVPLIEQIGSIGLSFLKTIWDKVYHHIQRHPKWIFIMIFLLIWVKSLTLRCYSMINLGKINYWLHLLRQRLTSHLKARVKMCQNCLNWRLMQKVEQLEQGIKDKTIAFHYWPKHKIWELFYEISKIRIGNSRPK